MRFVNEFWDVVDKDAEGTVGVEDIDGYLYVYDNKDGE